VYFYDLKSYLPDLGLLQEEILQNVRVDFLNFAKVTNLSPQPDAEQ
jgi:hypothetical protein